MSDLTVRPLSVVQQERAAFGLRSHDYARYRKHCASKLHHLRQSLHVTHGKGREFKKIAPVALDKAQDGHLLIHLFESERAYSHAQELLAAKDGDKHHAISRFRRAVHHSSSLLEYLPRLHTTSRAELAAYHLILSARYAIAKRDDALYNSALVQLATARTLLQALADAAGTSRDVALYTSFLDSAAPEVRFLAHELGHPRAWDTVAVCGDIKRPESEGAWPGFGALLEELEKAKGAKGQGELRPLVWEGTEVQVREPELVELLIRVQGAQGALTAHSSEPAAAPSEVPKEGKGKPRKKHRRTLLPAYDALLHALADAEDLARRLKEAQAATTLLAAAPQGGEKEADVGFLHAFVTYRLLATRIERDLLLVKMLENPPKHFAGGEQAQAKAGSSKAKEAAQDGPDDRTCLAIIKSLDAVLQSLEQMRELAVVEESVDVGEGIERRLNFTRAKRIEYLARLYASQAQYGESLALLARGTIYLRTVSASNTGTTSSPPELEFYPLPPTLAQSLSAQISALELKLKKDWYAATRKKPVFYDVAFNYVAQPGERVRQRAGLPAEEPAPTGIAVGAGSAGPKVPVKASEGGEKRQQVEREEEPALDGAQGKAGWSGYLGGWWGRK
ncbi:hypothetical protein CALVIDRAFT_359343 [Calocera viscosa TUFC12733]|uniref:Signal recognition particle subunit SRP68 n=1 Tax=Calocera viscosa (strain TUFC12733) TaxID=1330018 RepID=A0A167QIB1_CALVF|nr:hypothetical protein CALVIDRAFT_359343 [Calocera viscosa TUFC12733]